MTTVSTAGQQGQRDGAPSNGGHNAPLPEEARSLDWDYAQSAGQAGLYMAICELYQRHAGEGSVLDIGCGCGHLYHYLTEHARMPSHGYTGIDSAADAVRRAASRFPEAGFGQRDYWRESVGSRFDCVIFNDALQCFADPAAVLAKCTDRNMHACSLLIVAMAEGGHDAVWHALGKRYIPVDEKTVKNAEGKVWKVRALKLARDSG